MSVRSTVLSIIHHNKLHNFKISEVRDAAIGIVEAKSEAKLGVKVYKAVWVLTKQELLSVEKKTTNLRENIYSLTDAGRAAACSDLSTTTTAEVTTKYSKNHNELLQRKLSDYSRALATASAQAQEYQDLARELPEEMHEQLQREFLKSQGLAASYQGRLSAIESLLGEQYK